MSLHVKYAPVDPAVATFVQTFTMLENPSENERVATLLPDGMVDLLLIKVGAEPFRCVLRGIDTTFSSVQIAPHTRMFGIDFKPLAMEYVFKETVRDIANGAKNVDNDFWRFEETDLNDFEQFCQKATRRIQSVPVTAIDSRKQTLFERIYASDGSVLVEELAENIGWSARQINRYFNQQLGISLKAYCGILRFRASFEHIRQGKLFPEQNFFDQAHFIKEVKKLSGALPKELKQNKNDRFLQFLARLPS